LPGLRGPSPLLRLQSDERLIALTRRGHHAAFEALWSRYQARLLSFCRHMLGSREDAEDVLQEVFAAAFNAILADDRAINVRPWLYRIARNRSLNHLRKAAATGVDSMDIHYAEHGLTTSDKVIRRESFRELIADVHELPETQRTALLLREIDALSYEQIAQAMDTTVPSVKSLLVRARISLAEAAEARQMSCEEVRLELGETAEGLRKLSNPARRHVRGCDRCAFFKRQLRENNRALALVMPVGPLLLVKKLLLAKLGSTASAGGAHVAGGAGATVGAGATAGLAAGGGASVGGGLLTAGAGAIATKAAAGLAAAAIVTAGAVAADHAVVSTPRHAHHAHRTAPASAYAYSPPVVVHDRYQPATAGSVHRVISATRRPTRAVKPAPKPPAPATPTAAAVTPSGTSATPGSQAAPPTPAPSATPVTEVTTEATQLPTAATAPPAGGETAASPPPPLPTAEPLPPEPSPPATGSQPPPAPDAGGTEAPAGSTTATPPPQPAP
jgi:RNA polymerase sigma factor (sigma-70 family)